MKELSGSRGNNEPAIMKKKRLVLILFGVATALAFIAAVDAGCRIYLKRFDPDPVFYHGLMTYDFPTLDYGLRPDNEVTHKSFGRDVSMKINAQGFRHPEDMKTAKPPGLIRVFVLGGSAAFGLYATQNEMFSGLLDSYLKQEAVNIEVVNAAVPGYMTRQEYQMLKHRVMQFRPDIVILFNGLNDMGPGVI